MQLEQWEIARMTAAEVCIDELLCTLDRHGGHEEMYGTLKTISGWLDKLLLERQGHVKRYATLKGVRDRLDGMFPSAPSP